MLDVIYDLLMGLIDSHQQTIVFTIIIRVTKKELEIG